MRLAVLLSTILLINAEKLRYDEIPISEAIRHMKYRNRPREPKSDFLSMPEEADRIPFRISGEIQASTEVPVSSDVQSKEDSGDPLLSLGTGPGPVNADRFGGGVGVFGSSAESVGTGDGSESVRFGNPLADRPANTDDRFGGGVGVLGGFADYEGTSVGAESPFAVIFKTFWILEGIKT